MAWTEMTFGKYNGLTLPEVMFKDPDWFFWVCEQGCTGPAEAIKDEFEEIYRKSRNVKIPGGRNGTHEVRYYLDPIIEGAPIENTMCTGSFVTLDICKKGEINYSEDEGDKYVPRDVIDFMVPRELMKEDTDGYKIFIRKIKNIFFGALLRPVSMTREKCEEFFDNNDNFILND